MTLKAYKESVKVGQKMLVLEHWQLKYQGTVRTVTKVQHNGFEFTSPHMEGSRWSEFPRAGGLHFDGKIAQVTTGPGRFWTLELVDTTHQG